MDINTIITHLKNFSDTWNGWNGVITGLYRFNPLAWPKDIYPTVDWTKGFGQNIEAGTSNIKDNYLKFF